MDAPLPAGEPEADAEAPVIEVRGLVTRLGGRVIHDGPPKSVLEAAEVRRYVIGDVTA